MQKTLPMERPRQPVPIRRYAGQRFYRPATGTYLIRDNLMAKNGEKFVVIDADTNDDVTLSYHPIILGH